jgi:hypothetical protein
MQHSPKTKEDGDSGTVAATTAAAPGAAVFFVTTAMPGKGFTGANHGRKLASSREVTMIHHLRRREGHRHVPLLSMIVVVLVFVMLVSANLWRSIPSSDGSKNIISSSNAMSGSTTRSIRGGGGRTWVSRDAQPFVSWGCLSIIRMDTGEEWMLSLSPRDDRQIERRCCDPALFGASQKAIPTLLNSINVCIMTPLSLPCEPNKRFMHCFPHVHSIPCPTNMDDATRDAICGTWILPLLFSTTKRKRKQLGRKE